MGKEGWVIFTLYQLHDNHTHILRQMYMLYVHVYIVSRNIYMCVYVCMYLYVTHQISTQITTIACYDLQSRTKLLGHFWTFWIFQHCILSTPYVMWRKQRAHYFLLHTTFIHLEKQHCRRMQGFVPNKYVQDCTGSIPIMLST